MKSKIGRNDPCWCGSRKKYKKCHIDRESSDPPPLSFVLSSIREAMSRKTCLHPAAPAQCEGGIIRAHTVPRASLRRIAREGKLYGFEVDLIALMRNDGKLLPTLIGTKPASTFRGFCGFHDNGVFEPLETGDTVPLDRRSAFLLAYRAVSLELFKKRCALDMPQDMRELDRGRDPLAQSFLQSSVAGFETGNSIGEQELSAIKSECDAALLNQDYGNAHAAFFLLDRPPDVMCAGGFIPEFDFQGNQLADITAIHERLPSVTFTLMASGDHGLAAVAWHGDYEAPRRFAQSIFQLSDEEVPHALVRTAFEHCENIYLAPEWWERVDETQERQLLARFQYTADPINRRNANCLLEDDVRVVNWKVVQRSFLSL